MKDIVPLGKRCLTLQFMKAAKKTVSGPTIKKTGSNHESWLYLNFKYLFSIPILYASCLSECKERPSK